MVQHADIVLQELDRVRSISEVYKLHYINPKWTVSSPLDEMDLFLDHTERARNGWYRNLNRQYGNRGRKDLAKDLPTIQYKSIHRGLIVVNGNILLGNWQDTLDTVRDACLKY